MRHLTLSRPSSQTSSGLSHPLTVSQGLSGDLQMADLDLIFILSIHLCPMKGPSTTFPQPGRGVPPSCFSAPRAHLSRGLWMPSRTPDSLLSGHSRVYQCIDIFPSDELCGCAYFRARVRPTTPVFRHNPLIQVFPLLTKPCLHMQQHAYTCNVFQVVFMQQTTGSLHHAGQLWCASVYLFNPRGNRILTPSLCALGFH